MSNPTPSIPQDAFEYISFDGVHLHTKPNAAGIDYAEKAGLTHEAASWRWFRHYYGDSIDQYFAGDIMQRIPGWSGPDHYAFFKWLLATNPEAKSLLMLGVYHGRDIAFIQDILRRYHPGRFLEIVGIDRFSAEPCADWPFGAKSWEEVTGGMPPPSYGAALRNAGRPGTFLYEGDDEKLLMQFLADPMTPAFEIAYLDTAHDASTLIRQLAQVRQLVSPGAVICGDDYSDAGTWGVKTAVSEAFTKHGVFREWIWYAPAAYLKAEGES